MDYQEALNKLNKPVKKDSKVLGHKLVLRRIRPRIPGMSEESVALSYFSTNIIRWFPGGIVQINDGGFISSNYTLSKINEYLPMGWRLTTVPLGRFQDSYLFVAVLCGSTGRDRWAYAYSSKAMFSERGRTDSLETHAFDAFDLIQKTKALAFNVSEDFMAGRFSLKDFVRTPSTRPTEIEEAKALDILRSDFNTGSIMGLLHIDLQYDLQDSPYWEERFSFTSPVKGKSLKKAAEDFEFHLGNPEVPQRFKKNSSLHTDLKKLIYERVLEVVLTGLGFQVYVRQSFGHLRAFGR